MGARPVRLRSILLSLLVLAACTGASVSETPSPRPARPSPGDAAVPRPNVLVLVSDDQAAHLFRRELMPIVFEEIVEAGVNFTRAYVNLSQCCPSRATILTGLYSHHTGVDTNFKPLDGRDPVRPTIAPALQEAGYRTMLAGKYLNSQPCTPQPGWDRWVCSVGDRTADPVLDVDGEERAFRGYKSDVLADFVVDFLAEDPERPFFVLYAPSNPHLPADDPRAGSWPVPEHDPPSMNAQPDPETKPEWARLPPLSPARLARLSANRERMARQLPPLDAAIGRILRALGGRAEDTLVVYLSDNGFLYGEHRMTDKTQPYEESVRIPLALRYPRLLPAGRGFQSGALVGNVDVAATIMDAAGIPWEADGRSLLPLLRGEATSVREGLLLEWCQTGVGRCRSFGVGRPPPYWGIETDRFVLIAYDTGEEELYDLEADPHQLRNLAAEPSMRPVRDELVGRLASLRAPPPEPPTTIATGPGTEPGAASFAFFSPSTTTGFLCRLGTPSRAGPWAACDGGTMRYAGLDPGRYRFEVRAVDRGGAVDGTPAVRVFDVRP